MWSFKRPFANYIFKAIQMNSFLCLLVSIDIDETQGRKQKNGDHIFGHNISQNQWVREKCKIRVRKAKSMCVYVWFFSSLILSSSSLIFSSRMLCIYIKMAPLSLFSYSSSLAKQVPRMQKKGYSRKIKKEEGQTI